MSCAFEAGTEKLDHPLLSSLSCWFFPLTNDSKQTLSSPNITPKFSSGGCTTSLFSTTPHKSPAHVLGMKYWGWFQFFILSDTLLLTPPLSHYSSSTFCCLFLFCRAWISWDSTTVTNTKTFTFLLLCSAVVFICQNPKSHCPNFPPFLCLPTSWFILLEKNHTTVCFLAIFPGNPATFPS